MAAMLQPPPGPQSPSSQASLEHHRALIQQASCHYALGEYRVIKLKKQNLKMPTRGVSTDVLFSLKLYICKFTLVNDFFSFHLPYLCNLVCSFMFYVFILFIYEFQRLSSRWCYCKHQK